MIQFVCIITIKKHCRIVQIFTNIKCLLLSALSIWITQHCWHIITPNMCIKQAQKKYAHLLIVKHFQEYFIRDNFPFYGPISQSKMETEKHIRISSSGTVQN